MRTIALLLVALAGAQTTTVPVTFAWPAGDPSHEHPSVTWESERNGVIAPCGSVTVTNGERRCTSPWPLGSATFRIRGTSVDPVAGKQVGAWSVAQVELIAAPGVITITAHKEAPAVTTITVLGVTPWASGVSATVTTASFPITAGDVLLVVAVIDTNGPEPTSSLASVPDRTWRAGPANTGPNGAQVKTWTAPVTAAGTQTVALTASLTYVRAVQVYRLAGVDPAQPIGASWVQASTVNDWTPTTYTSTRPGSLGIAVAADWVANGAPTSTDIPQPGHYSAGGVSMSWISVRKAGTTPAVAPVPFSFNAAGAAAAAWRAVSVEIRPR